MLGVSRTEESAAEAASAEPSRGDLNCEAALGVTFLLAGTIFFGGDGADSNFDGNATLVSFGFGPSFSEEGARFFMASGRNGVASFLCCNFWDANVERFWAGGGGNAEVSDNL